MRGWTRRLSRGGRWLVAILVALILLSTTSYATTAYLVGKAAGLDVTHANLPQGQRWAGTFKVTLNGSGPHYEVYCIQMEEDWCPGEYYGQGPNIAERHIVWILNHYYPHVPDKPSGLSDSRRAAAVQLAIWHFSDGLDISSGGSPDAVFDAARAIIAAAEEASVPRVPSTLTLTPSSAVRDVGEEHTVTAALEDQNGDPLPGETISFTVTGANEVSGSAVTDSTGRAIFTYRLEEAGEDTITASVSYTVPVGLRWILEGCQELIMAEEAPSELRTTATVTTEEAPTATPPQSPLPIGGVAVPSSPASVLGPWVGLVALFGLALVGGSLLVARRQQRR